LPVPTAPGAIVADRPEDIRARRAALNPHRLDGPARLGLATYRAAATIDPRLRLMLAMEQPAGPISDAACCRRAGYRRSSRWQAARAEAGRPDVWPRGLLRPAEQQTRRCGKTAPGCLGVRLVPRGAGCRASAALAAAFPPPHIRIGSRPRLGWKSTSDWLLIA
jgi:hypothetical protein